MRKYFFPAVMMMILLSSPVLALDPTSSLKLTDPSIKEFPISSDDTQNVVMRYIQDDKDYEITTKEITEDSVTLSFKINEKTLETKPIPIEIWNPDLKAIKSARENVTDENWEKYYTHDATIFKTFSTTVMMEEDTLGQLVMFKLGSILKFGTGTDIVQISVFEFDTIEAAMSSTVRLNDTAWMTAWMGSGYHGFIGTFTADENWENIAEIQSIEHNTVIGQYNSLAQLDDDCFILAYRGDSGLDGYLATFTAGVGHDNIVKVDEIEHDAVDGAYCSIIKKNTTTAILSVSGGGFDGYVKTIEVDSNCDNIRVIDSLEHHTTDIYNSDLALIDDTHFVLTYAEYATPSYDGWIKTFSIDAYADSITQIDALKYVTPYGLDPSIVLIDPTHAIATIRGADIDGWAYTFSWDGSYDNIAIVDSTEFDPVATDMPSLVMINSTYFLNAYNGGTGQEGFIEILKIDGSYAITEIDSLKHTTTMRTYSVNSLAKLDDTHYVLTYRDTSDDGQVKIFEIPGGGEEPPEDECTITSDTIISADTDCRGEDFYVAGAYTVQLLDGIELWADRIVLWTGAVFENFGGTIRLWGT